MKIREEKNGNFWVFCTGMMLWYFMSGIEYGIILANINDYLLKGFGSNVRVRFLWERTLDNYSDICSIQAPNKWSKVSLLTKNGPKLALEHYHQNRSFVVEFRKNFAREIVYFYTNLNQKKVGAPQKSIGYAFTFFAFSGLISSPIYG